MKERGDTVGHVIQVENHQAVVELDEGGEGFIKTDVDGPHAFARINGYVIVDAGEHRIIGMITKVRQGFEQSGESPPYFRTPRRYLDISLVGALKPQLNSDNPRFQPGLTTWPPLDSPVRYMRPHELGSMFGRDEGDGGYLKLGQALNASERSVFFKADEAFGKHTAVLGSTGSGKTCTVAGMLQGIHQASKQANVIILDINGEYAAALRDAPTFELSLDDGADAELELPAWLMNVRELASFFKATAKTQLPALQRAIASPGVQTPQFRLKWLVAGVERLKQDCVREWSDSVEETWKTSGVTENLRSLKEKLRDPPREQHWGETARKFVSFVERLEEEGVIHQNGKGYWVHGLKENAGDAEELTKLTTALLEKASALEVDGTDVELEPDLPIPYPVSRLSSGHVRSVARAEDLREEYLATLFLRLDAKFNDGRFSFILNDKDDDARQDFERILRILLGVGEEPPGELFPSNESPKFTIVNLDGVPGEVIEEVTALIGRLTLDTLQRTDTSQRGKCPFLLVCEEAHNYIPWRDDEEQPSPSKYIFERIAKEGRKYGLGLLLSSQRPSELSETVLAQCHSFVVHRLQNPRDLEHFRRIVPVVHKPLLDQLPSMAPQTALALGAAFKAPVHCRVTDTEPPPSSENPSFWDFWNGDQSSDDILGLSDLVQRWQGQYSSVEQSEVENNDDGEESPANGQMSTRKD